MMMVKCRCVLHEFSITTSTSTTKMMMIITMATMLINKRKLCQPQNVCIVYAFCAGVCSVCAVHFLTVYFWLFSSSTTYFARTHAPAWVSKRVVSRRFRLFDSNRIILLLCVYVCFPYVPYYMDILRPDLPSYAKFACVCSTLAHASVKLNIPS